MNKMGDVEVGHAELLGQADAELGVVPVIDGGVVITHLDIKAGAGHVDLHRKDIEDDIHQGPVQEELGVFFLKQGKEASPHINLLFYAPFGWPAPKKPR